MTNHETAAVERVARHLAAKDHPDTEWTALTSRCREAYLADARGVLAAVSVPPPATRADDRAAVLREGAEALGRMDYDTDSHDYGYDTYRDAWNGGVMDAADLLRRLADESAVVPPPALTEEGRLRAQVEVLQQDAERDRGLAKVGARCMRDGHQGLIEQGRLVLEGWRFALSTALDLGTGAPWEAIHERVKELCPAADVSGPVAGEQQNETPEAETGCAHCGKPVRLITGTLAQWWVHEPGGHTICQPEHAASSLRATPRPAAGVRQDGVQS